MTSSKTSLFTWLSFLPALAYWILESQVSPMWALVGGMGIALVEITIEKIFSGHIHTLTKVNTALILLLGGLGLWAQDGLWFKLQPVFTGFIMSGFLTFYGRGGKSLLLETMNELQPEAKMPEAFVRQMESHMKIFLVVYSLWMLPVALKMSTSQWLFWKTGGFYIATVVFFIFQLWWFKKKMRS